MPEQHAGSVSYVKIDEQYFQNRELKRHAGPWSLWALGVGAVISGDFFGWNFGLTAGGFGGLLAATVVITIMYLGLCYSIAEMTAALPHTGGAYSFSRSAMGPWGGYITGLAENMEYILTPAVIVVGIGGYLGAIFETPDSLDWIWWLASYLIFVGLNIWGIEITFRFTVFITFISLAILAVFYIGAIPHFDMNHALNIEPAEGGTRWFPQGWSGITAALPFAIWFYLAIEQLPLAAEESHDPKTDMPKGLLYGIMTLIVCAFLTLFLNAGIAPGSAEVGASDEPLFLGFRTIFGDGIGAKVLAAIAVAGLIASFHSIIFAYGRNIYSLSRAGYFPKWLSVTHSDRKTPHIALITGAVMGFIVALIIHFSGSDFVGAILLNMAVFGAVIAYIMQMLSFLLLRRKYPQMERPYVSTLGNWGAIAALIISVVTLIFLFINPDYRPGVYGCALWFFCGIAYFYCWGRKMLVKAPEEEFALSELTRE